MNTGLNVFVFVAIPCAAFGAGAFDEWPPRDYFIASLVGDVPDILKEYDAETGRFGDEPWICQDQNGLFALAAAWALEDPQNPHYHDSALLRVIARGGEALVDDMDERGMWTFRKKDNSTWGQIHMPWTYSRWIRAYALVKDALPDAARATWERGLLLGFSGIRKYMDGGVHNIPAHHAMGLYIAGQCFDNPEWREAAQAYMARVVEEQTEGGYWSEHCGPVVGYNAVYVEALGVYYHASNDPVALDALERSARFHASVLWPDGSSVACIDERQAYRKGVTIGNVGFSWSPEGRGFLLQQLARYSGPKNRRVSGDYAASMLLYGGCGAVVMPPSSSDRFTRLLDNDRGLIRREAPWQWAMAAYVCEPFTSRWIQDRQNLADVYHDALGLVIGGGHTKLQPYWSTFTVGDASLLRHTEGDTDPVFVPAIDLLWTPSAAEIADAAEASRLALGYGGVNCSVEIRSHPDGSLTLCYRAPEGQRAEAHVPFLRRAARMITGRGETHELGEANLTLTSEAIGAWFELAGLRVAMPPGASLRWPEKQHNPYTKDGRSSLDDAKLVLVLPFVEVEEYCIELRLTDTTSPKEDE